MDRWCRTGRLLPPAPARGPTRRQPRRRLRRMVAPRGAGRARAPSGQWLGTYLHRRGHALRRLCMADRSRPGPHRRRARPQCQRCHRARARGLGSAARRLAHAAAAPGKPGVHAAVGNGARARAGTSPRAPQRPDAPGRGRARRNAGNDVRRSPVPRHPRRDAAGDARLPALDRLPRVDARGVLRRLAVSRGHGARAPRPPPRHGQPGRGVGVAGLWREPGRDAAWRRACLVRCGGDVRVPAAGGATTRNAGTAPCAGPDRCLGTGPPGTCHARIGRWDAAPGGACGLAVRRCGAGRGRRCLAGRR